MRRRLGEVLVLVWVRGMVVGRRFGNLRAKIPTCRTKKMDGSENLPSSKDN